MLPRLFASTLGPVSFRLQNPISESPISLSYLRWQCKGRNTICHKQSIFDNEFAARTCKERNVFYSWTPWAVFILPANLDKLAFICFVKSFQDIWGKFEHKRNTSPPIVLKASIQLTPDSFSSVGGLFEWFERSGGDVRDSLRSVILNLLQFGRQLIKRHRLQHEARLAPLTFFLFSPYDNYLSLVTKFIQT